MCSPLVVLGDVRPSAFGTSGPMIAAVLGFSANASGREAAR
ncbi:hypothetical protein GJR88_03075 [Dietzia sp. DQ12-45-1b]|nr:hypothetical protein GJR88_03075 [Dietzia sp. DQ12-45-1b]